MTCTVVCTIELYKTVSRPPGTRVSFLQFMSGPYYTEHFSAIHSVSSTANQCYIMYTFLLSPPILWFVMSCDLYRVADIYRSTLSLNHCCTHIHIHTYLLKWYSSWACVSYDLLFVCTKTPAAGNPPTAWLGH